MDFGAEGYRLNVFVYHEDPERAMEAGSMFAKVMGEALGYTTHVVYPVADDLLSYKREKILLWGDFNYQMFSTVLGKDDNIRDMMEIFPEHKYVTRFTKQGQKYSLSHDINIFTSSRPYDQFVHDVYNKECYFVVHHAGNIHETQREAVEEVKQNLPFNVCFEGNAMKVYADHNFIEKKEFNKPVCLFFHPNPFLKENYMEALEEAVRTLLRKAEPFSKVEMFEQKA